MSNDKDQTGPARNALNQSIAIKLVNAGILTPAADFVSQVRSEAGFRASPRQISAALEGLADTGEDITAESVANLVAASRGDRSQRQRRRAPEWQALGTALTLQNLDGSPEGQREFIGIARQVAGPRATDALLLQVSLTLAGEGVELDPRSVGLVTKRIARSAADLTESQLTTQLMREWSNLNRVRTPRQQRRSSVAARRRQTGPPEHVNKPGKRRWKPGGRRRRTIQFPKTTDEDR
ncbi:MAG TPA: hypothetical protein VHG52_12385 [Thermomicrobiales bacterium]|nr:hypothetical protein [Thermomicrobiales bacterium]